MQVIVKVITRAKHNKIIKEPDGSFKLWTTAVPADQKANKSVIEILAKYFKTPKSGISIIRGRTSNRKILEIED